MSVVPQFSFFPRPPLCKVAGYLGIGLPFTPVSSSCCAPHCSPYDITGTLSLVQSCTSNADCPPNSYCKDGPGQSPPYSCQN